jgi:hypothetical protein
MPVVEVSTGRSQYWADLITNELLNLKVPQLSAQLSRFSKALEQRSDQKRALLHEVSARIFDQVCDVVGIDPRRPREPDEDSWQMHEESRTENARVVPLFLAVHLWCNHEADRLGFTLPRSFSKQPHHLENCLPSRAQVFAAVEQLYSAFGERAPSLSRNVRLRKVYFGKAASLPEGDTLQRLRDGRRLQLPLLILMLDPHLYDTSVVCRLVAHRLIEGHIGEVTLRNARFNLHKVLEEHFASFDQREFTEVMQLKREIDQRLKRAVSANGESRLATDREAIERILQWKAAAAGVAEQKEPMTLSSLARDVAIAIENPQQPDPLRLAIALRNADVVLERGFPGRIHAKIFKKSLAEARIAVEYCEKDPYEVLCLAIERIQKLVAPWL